MDSIISLSKQSMEQPEKRTSITNIFNCDKPYRISKEQKTTSKQIDKLKQAFKRMQNNIGIHKFSQFDLKQMQANEKLVKNNRHYAQLLDRLKTYNKKLQQCLQNDIVNYRLYQFLYFTAKICNTKTESEANFYLKQVDNWLSVYNRKRQIIIQANKKYKDKKSQQDIIRQTYKSNLPLQIDQYNRKICKLSRPKDDRYKRIQNKLGKSFNFMNKFDNDSDKSDQFLDFQSQEPQIVENVKNLDRKKELQLPDLRSYKMEVARLRSAIEERQDKQMLQLMKRNQSRIQSQSSNNFFKPLRNRKDIFNKTTFNKKQQDELCKKTTTLDEGDSAYNTRRQLQQNEQLKQNRVIINSTCIGFNEIKKKNLDRQLGKKKYLNSTSTFPRFFSNTYGFGEGNSGNNELQTTLKQNDPIIENISGFNLIRNPFEITKAKKEKKNK